MAQFMIPLTFFTPQMELQCANQFLEDIPGWSCRGLPGFFTPERLNQKFQDGILWKRAIGLRGFGDTPFYDNNMRAVAGRQNKFHIYNVVSESSINFCHTHFAAHRMQNPHLRQIYNIASSSMSLYNGLSHQMPVRRSQHNGAHQWALANPDLDYRLIPNSLRKAAFKYTKQLNGEQPFVVSAEFCCCTTIPNRFEVAVESGVNSWLVKAEEEKVIDDMMPISAIGRGTAANQPTLDLIDLMKQETMDGMLEGLLAPEDVDIDGQYVMEAIGLTILDDMQSKIYEGLFHHISE